MDGWSRGPGEAGGPLRRRYQERKGLVLPAGLTRQTVHVGGVERTFWLAPIPAGDRGRSPILLVLHGAGGQGPGMAALSGLDRRGPAAGFVTVFPDGQGRVWSDAREGQHLRRRHGVDDIGFLAAVVAQLGSFGAGKGSVYLAGMSNGSLLAEHVARHGLIEVAAIGLVAGPGTQASRAGAPRPARPATVVIFAGTADPLIPYQGGPIGPLGRVMQRGGGPSTAGRGLAVAAETAAADWARANGIDGPPTVERLPTGPGDLPVTRLSWQAPETNPVVLYRIQGGGHTWPGVAPYLPERIIGRSSRSLDTTEALLGWFRAAR